MYRILLSISQWEVIATWRMECLYYDIITAEPMGGDSCMENGGQWSVYIMTSSLLSQWEVIAAWRMGVNGVFIL